MSVNANCLVVRDAAVIPIDFGVRHVEVNLTRAPEPGDSSRDTSR